MASGICPVVSCKSSQVAASTGAITLVGGSANTATITGWYPLDVVYTTTGAVTTIYVPYLLNAKP